MSACCVHAVEINARNEGKLCRLEMDGTKKVPESKFVTVVSHVAARLRAKIVDYDPATRHVELRLRARRRLNSVIRQATRAVNEVFSPRRHRRQSGAPSGRLRPIRRPPAVVYTP